MLCLDKENVFHFCFLGQNCIYVPSPTSCQNEEKFHTLIERSISQNAVPFLFVSTEKGKCSLIDFPPKKLGPSSLK